MDGAGEPIYETTVDANTDEIAGTPTDRRGDVKILPKSGDNVSSIEVTLSAAVGDWGLNNNNSLIIRFGIVTAPIPSSLPYQDKDDAGLVGPHYNEYRFTASSKVKDGSLRALIPKDDTDDTDNIDASDPQPRVRVGNVGPGEAAGTVTITPAEVYGNEKGRDFRITFKAKGPIYNSALQITIPEELIPDALPEDVADYPSFIVAHTTVSQRGGVDFGPRFSSDSDAPDGPDGVTAD